MQRILTRGDAIVTELSPRYPDGSEIQTGRAYVLGGTTPEYERIAELMLELYSRIVDQLRPGKTDVDVLSAAQFVKDAGYTWLSPLVHGPEGGGTGALPIIASSVRQAEAQPFVFGPNMAMVVQAHVGLADNSAGLFMADTWVTTEAAPRPLNRYRRELIRI